MSHIVPESWSIIFSKLTNPSSGIVGFLLGALLAVGALLRRGALRLGIIAVRLGLRLVALLHRSARLATSDAVGQLTASTAWGSFASPAVEARRRISFTFRLVGSYISEIQFTDSRGSSDTLQRSNTNMSTNETHLLTDRRADHLLGP